MDLHGVLDVLMFATLVGALMCGFPVAFTIGGVALAFGALGLALGVFQPGFLAAFPQRVFGTMTNQALTAVPLFILMGVVLERSKIAEDLVTTMGDLFGKARGGLLFATTLVGALLAASTGVVGATVVTMGLLALPAMLARGYSRPLAAGTIATAGTLGQVIPPSVVLILLGDVIGSATQRAAAELGVAARSVSVGDLFAGALVPGLVLVGLYLAWLAAVVWLRPDAAPAGAGGFPGGRRIASALAAPLLLILAVLGSILAGVATPTEGAAVGAAGAILLAGFRLERDAGRAGSLPARLVLAGGASVAGLTALGLAVGMPGAQPDPGAMHVAVALALCAGATAGLLAGLLALSRAREFGASLRATVDITAMVFTILIGAVLFSLVFRGLGGDEWIAGLLETIPGGLTGALAMVMLVIFVLGFFLDFIEICTIVVPLVATPLIMMGADPVWLGVLIAVMLQTSFLTPPFGFALFYLRGVAGDRLTTLEIYRGVVPFIVLQLVGLGLVWAIPALATWLPAQLYR
jgi:TRAP-type mannitol/chloroaromatic compound transport system permease large subunit